MVNDRENFNGLSWFASTGKDDAITLMSQVTKILKGDQSIDTEHFCGKYKIKDSNVKSCVESLAELLIELVRSKLSEDDVQKKLTLMNWTSDQIEPFVGTMMDEKNRILHSLDSLDHECSAVPSYNNLEWRLEVKTASRMLRNQLEPSILLGLELANSDGSLSKLNLNCDPACVLHLKDVLEEALAEGQSVHVQKLTRHLK
ncbi:COMM domain-containing protein 2 [Halotydeus destructor]|nr:COMM domain-containing protein 2 [Halotydeus destructor]